MGLAVFTGSQGGEDASFALLPADHVIEDAQGFQATLESAFEAAEGRSTGDSRNQGNDFRQPDMDTWNRDPTWANMRSFGGRGEPVFVEKPNAVKAQEYVNAGNYFWNAGMFVQASKCDSCGN